MDINPEIKQPHNEMRIHMKKLSNERKTEVVGGLGWQWKCLTTGWESGWHLTYSGALKLATSHEQKYPGHKTTVFAV